MNITIEDLCHDSRRRSQATLTRFGLLGLAASLPNNRITHHLLCAVYQFVQDIIGTERAVSLALYPTLQLQDELVYLLLTVD